MNDNDEKTPPPRATPQQPASPRHAALADCDVFVERVREACLRPGTQQALRRALAKPVHEVPARTHAALLRDGLVPDGGAATKRAYYSVAALIAVRPRTERLLDTTGQQAAQDSEKHSGTHPAGTQPLPPAERIQPGATADTTHTPSQVSWGTSLGASLAQAVSRGGQDGIKEDGAESRLHLLVRQETDGMHRMLPAVLRLTGSAGVATDYGRLLYDVRRWQYDRDTTSTRWLEDYYRVLRRSGRPHNL
ncbi:type I-E CRISPR-associated protein Cse2/CasB [Streptomyces niveus]|uniref:type I-E CRISPR-associated protein Cse2/CasB n=1 Tax=Streptomyces niveus TaxID=193462 RepID=UPI0034243BA2